jgi:UDP-glucose 4-epimerase
MAAKSGGPPPGRVVLVTGVSRHLGGRLARELVGAPGVERVIGVDVIPPPGDLGGAEFVRADIRNPIIAKVITAAGVDTVVHMSVIATPVSAGGRTSMKEINVIGTMQLLAACQKADSIRKLVVKSSTAVYGASPKDPGMFTEDMEPKAMPRSGFGKDSVEVEGYVRGFARRRPDVTVSMARFANFLGPRIDTPFTSYFQLPVIPTVFGFDLLRRLTLEDHPGTFNAAGEGALLLSQAAHRAGRPTLPLPSPLVSAFGDWIRRSRIVDFSPEQIRFLSYGRMVDTSRAERRIGWTPKHSTRETFDAFVADRGINRHLPAERVEALEHLVAGALSRGGGA